MIYTLAVAAGGALGAVSRYWLVTAMSGSRFPWGTFTVNVAGSLVIGVLYVLISEKAVLAEQWRAILMVGYLGAFTTFSTFSLDALLLLQDGRPLQAALYVLGSVVTCLLGAWLGMTLMRAI